MLAVFIYQQGWHMINSELSKFIDIYNDIEKYPTLSNVAMELGISIKTIRNKVGFLRNIGKHDPSAPKLIKRVTHSETPMSEDSSKFMEHWGPDECIEELRRIAELNPEMVVTRNYFRNNSTISESTWNRYFGVFEEFKRQAGIKLSRQQHAHERFIAKHASVDHYRKMNVERADYANKFERINKNRFKTLVTCSDLHDIEIDPFYLRVLLDTINRVQPDNVALVGDVFDLPEFGKYSVDPREWDVVGRIKFAHDNILEPMRKASPESQIDLIEGNHEARLLRQLADATPALRAVLSDLHGFTVGKLLGLDRFEINYIAKADLGSFTKREFDRELENNYKVYYDAFLCHHFPHARNMGMPGVNGHHHSHHVWSMFNPVYGAYEWHQMGAGHRRKASYCEGEKWHNGFSVVHIDTRTKAVNFDYVPVTDFAVSGGKWYHREPSEVYGALIK
jgi:hypothetical protein